MAATAPPQASPEVTFASATVEAHLLAPQPWHQLPTLVPAAAAISPGPAEMGTDAGIGAEIEIEQGVSGVPVAIAPPELSPVGSQRRSPAPPALVQTPPPLQDAPLEPTPQAGAAALLIGQLGSESLSEPFSEPLPGPTVDQLDSSNATDSIAESRPVTLSPLQRHPLRIGPLETANLLPPGALQFSAGWHQPLSGDRPNSGTGDEVYGGTVDWAINQTWQLGVTGLYYDDPTNRQVNGQFPNLQILAVGPNVHYRLLDEPDVAISLVGSVEQLQLSTSPGLFNDQPTRPIRRSRTVEENLLIGSLQLPITLQTSPDVQLHLTPGIAFFPDEINNADFFGTFITLAAGVSWQAAERLNLYASASYPMGPGGNTFSADDTDIFRRLVWAAGARYVLTPQVGVELYGTNGLGQTPTTSMLAFIPDGDQFLLGARLTYAPDVVGYGASFRRSPSVPLSQRDTQLLWDGLTLETASTLPPTTLSLSAGLGTSGNNRVLLAYGLTPDLQLELLAEQFGGSDSVSSDESAGPGMKLGPGVRLRFLDQVQGDPVSLALRVLGVRTLDSNPRVGTLYASLPVVYQASPELALFFTPKAAFFGNDDQVGLGLGLNYALTEQLQVIGEVTPVLDGEHTVWSAGLRYHHPGSNLGVDLYGSNAIGQNGLGSLVAESGTNIGFNLRWLIGAR